MKRGVVHLIVKEVFNRTATRIRERGDAQSEIVATRVESASAHWLRHTAGSNMANSMDLRNVRDNLGHTSIATTNIYLHTEDDQRHEETEANHHIGW
jgi:site-specific recombinase XerD